MEICADRRCRQHDPDPERVRLAREVAERFRREQLRLAKVLVAIESGRDHLGYGHASVRDFAVLELGLARRDLSLLLDLGRSLEFPTMDSEELDGGAGGEERDQGQAADGESAERDPHDDGASGAETEVPNAEVECPPRTLAPTVEDRVRGRRMPVDNAAQLGRLFRAVGAVPESDRSEWVRAAEVTSPWRFMKLVRQALEDAAQAERTVSLGLSVTESARDDFRRARELASRRAGRILTEGQAFAVVVRRYVAGEDERLVGTKKRRVGPTEGLPGRRYVPAAVQRAIRKRADDRCEVPGCSHGGFLQLMHVRTPHASGGAREEHDLALGCSTHHVLLDAGVIRFAGWDETAPDGVRRPRFRAANGRLLGVARPYAGDQMRREGGGQVCEPTPSLRRPAPRGRGRARARAPP
jgi:hypothetical protein